MSGYWLGGISSGTPGCEVISQEEQPCGRGSHVRLRTQCNGCGSNVLRFFCKQHERGLDYKQVVCYHCKSKSIWVKVS